MRSGPVTSAGPRPGRRSGWALPPLAYGFYAEGQVTDATIGIAAFGTVAALTIGHSAETLRSLVRKHLRPTTNRALKASLEQLSEAELDEQVWYMGPDPKTGSAARPASA